MCRAGNVHAPQRRARSRDGCRSNRDRRAEISKMGARLNGGLDGARVHGEGDMSREASTMARRSTAT